MQADSGPVLRFETAAPSADQPAPSSEADTRVVVLDTAWTPSPAQAAVGCWIAARSVAAAILADVDLLAEATRRLDSWVSATTVIDDMTIDGTSLWYYVRLQDHGWLQQRMLWAMIVDAIVREVRPSRIELADDVDAALAEVAALIARRDGLSVDGELASRTTWPAVGAAVEPPSSEPPRASFVARVIRRLRAAVGRPTGADLRRGERMERRRLIAERLDRLAAEGERRLLVVLEHARQRVETPAGARQMNPFLGPIVDVLRGGPLDPIELDLRAKVDDDEIWSRLIAEEGERLLPVSVISGALDTDDDPDDAASSADEAAAARIAAADAPLVVAEIDLGPLLAGHIAQQARQLLPSKRRAVRRIRRLLARLQPAGVLLADEYHRQEWLIAAAAEGVPVAAVQHGILHRSHNGYIHRSRPAGLRLPGRTYVFGRWERDLLIEQSVFRPDEVVVGGSPRLDLLDRSSDPAAIRADLGIAPGDRLVVVSGTNSAIIRRFQVPMALDALVDRPLPAVHVVVKLHPGENDDGPYRATLASAAAARGIAAPPVTLVRSIDLYGLLAAADAHIGIHSTLLTEAVISGTPNLLFASFASADLLGYVDAGVAVPFRSGADLLAALESGAGHAEPEARRAFIDAHFEPGSASRRIADDLSAWLA